MYIKAKKNRKNKGKKKNTTSAKQEFNKILLQKQNKTKTRL
jgi:hypothetical protein